MKMTYSFPLRFPLAILAGIIALFSSAHAQITYSWTAASSSAWETAGNWSPSGNPGAFDTIGTQTSTTAAALNGDASVAAFDVNSSSAWTITVGGSGNRTLSAGSITKAGNGVLSITGRNSTNGLNLSISGNMTLTTGTLTLGASNNAANNLLSLNVVGATSIGSGGINVRADSATFGSVDLTQSNSVLEVNRMNSGGGSRGVTVSSLSGIGKVRSSGLASTVGNVTGTLTINGGGGAAYNGVVEDGAASHTFVLIKSGAGTETLAGSTANTFTGLTTVNGGTLILNKTSGVDALGSGGSKLMSGGTLQLAGSNQINNSGTMELNGGTYNLNGFSEGSAAADGLGALSLTATSIIDFGSLDNGNVLRFSSLGTHTSGAKLQIINWDGTVGGGGSEKLLFSGLISDFSSLYLQSEVSFNGMDGYSLFQNASYYEVSAIPEPGTSAILAILLISLLGGLRRRSNSSFLK